MNKIKFYGINPLKWNQLKKIIGFFRFSPCECGCTKNYGWGFNCFLFGFNIQYKNKN